MSDQSTPKKSKAAPAEPGTTASVEPEAATPPSERKPSRLQQIMVEYGVIGVIVLLSLSALSYLGFLFAFMVGFEVDGAGETATAFAAALAGWAATKPIRIPLAVVLTPVVAALWHRLRGRSPPEAAGPDAAGPDAAGPDAG